MTDITNRIADDVLPPRYVSPQRVASGGMGEVYRATDSVLGRTVAVKMLAERHARSEDVRARFKREALAAAQLSSHRHVVTVFDVGEHDGRPFIVMEFFEGGSVHDRLRTSSIESALALDWLTETAGALDEAHTRGIVHRDVKPANLMLDLSDHVHVADFGIASAAGLDTLTMPGTVLGTAGYLAPEQARGEPATAASDRYALGVVAFELLTGKRPFAADTPVTEALGHLNAEVPSAAVLDPSLPSGVDKVLQRALAKDPDERPTTARELADDLRESFAGDTSTTLVQAPPRVPVPVPVAGPSTPTPTRTPTPPPPPPSPGQPATRRYDRGRRRSLIYALVALGVLLAGIATAAVIAASSDDPNRSATGTGGTTTQTTTEQPPPAPEPPPPKAPEPPPPPPPPPPPTSDPVALGNQGFALQEDGDYNGALPLLEQAVAGLAGSGSLAEAYASYNLAFTRFALGRCDGVLDLLDQSEAIQGRRSEINRLRQQARRTCEGGNSGDGGGDEDD